MELSTSPTIEDYVLQEARERAFEVSVEGVKEYERLMERTLAEKKVLIDEEFRVRTREQEIQAKIRHSAAVSANRLKKMEARQELITSLLQEVFLRVKAKISDRAFYRAFLVNLVVESAFKLGESTQFVRTLEKDSGLASELVSEAAQLYSQIVKQQDVEGLPPNADIRVDSQNFLEESKSLQFLVKGEEDRVATGGVLLATEDGLIVCKNTVDVRLEMAYQSSLPQIRRALFGNESQ